ncbi:MAG: ABC transporter permease, partial [Chryseolinea sp.]
MNYLKTAFRTQLKHRTLSLINILGLSIGVCCAIVVFLYVDGHLGTDRFHQNEDKIYRLVLDIQTPSGEIEYDEASAIAVAKALQDDYAQIETTAFCMRFYTTPTITVTSGLNQKKFKDDKTVAYADNNFIRLFEHDFLHGDQLMALKDPSTAVLSEAQALKYFGTS